MKSKKTFIFFVFFIITFIFLSFVQIKNNALPFFFKSYPTYHVNSKMDFDPTSESLIKNRIHFTILNLKYDSHFNLWRLNNDINADPLKDTYNPNIIYNKADILDGHPYTSQLALQALFWSKVSNTPFFAQADFSSLKIINSILISFCLSIFLLWIHQNWGQASSIIALVCINFSTGLNIYLFSLYWSAWLFLIPASFVMLWDLAKLEKSYIFYTTLFFLFLIKFLSGYEFISLVVLLACFPLVWRWVSKGNPRNLTNAFFIGVCSILAFIASLLIYDTAYLSEFSTSGIEHLSGRSGSWSLSALSDNPINETLLSILKLLIINSFDFNGFGIPLGIILLIEVYLILKIKCSNRNFLFILFLWSIGFSWFFLQPYHLLFHPRYSTFVMSMSSVLSLSYLYSLYKTKLT